MISSAVKVASKGDLPKGLAIVTSTGPAGNVASTLAFAIADAHAGSNRSNRGASRTTVGLRDATTAQTTRATSPATTSRRDHGSDQGGPASRLALVGSGV